MRVIGFGVALLAAGAAANKDVDVTYSCPKASKDFLRLIGSSIDVCTGAVVLKSKRLNGAVIFITCVLRMLVVLHAGLGAVWRELHPHELREGYDQD
jgi:hypothetical protein